MDGAGTFARLGFGRVALTFQQVHIYGVCLDESMYCDSIDYCDGHT